MQPSTEQHPPSKPVPRVVAPPRGSPRAVRGAAAGEPPSETVTEPDIEVRRSRKRIRTVTAFRDGDRTIVAIPARFTRAQEREWVVRMVTRLADQERRRRPSDTELATRAAELSARYLSGRAIPLSVAWSTNQGRRWGSCTPTDATIRISDRVRGMPSWVLDYVLLHELTHLLHAGHTPAFWAELEAYPRTARARGFLEGVAYTHERVGGESDAAGDPVDAEVDDAEVGDGEVDGAEVDDGEVDGAEVDELGAPVDDRVDPDRDVRVNEATVADRDESTTSGRRADTLFD